MEYPTVDIHSDGTTTEPYFKGYRIYRLHGSEVNPLVELITVEKDFDIAKTVHRLHAGQELRRRLDWGQGIIVWPNFVSGKEIVVSSNDGVPHLRYEITEVRFVKRNNENIEHERTSIWRREDDRPTQPEIHFGLFLETGCQSPNYKNVVFQSGFAYLGSANNYVKTLAGPYVDKL